MWGFQMQGKYIVQPILSPKYGLVNALFDHEDWFEYREWSKYVWGSKRHTGLYVMAYPPGDRKKALRIHRMIMKAKPGEIVDHINGNPLDNRKENLRITTSLVNNQNARKRKDGVTSKHKGVSWCKSSKKWKAQIQINKKKKSLGSYKTEIEAAIAYNKALDFYDVKSPRNSIG